MKRSMARMKSLGHYYTPMMAEWIFYFPTEEDAMAFKLRWL